jgi:hypothetical protein
MICWKELCAPALISDVQLFEEFPALYTADTNGATAGSAATGKLRAGLPVCRADVRRVANPLTGLSRWKIFVIFGAASFPSR